MACYRLGGCGPYEYRSCSECPASKPSYLNKMSPQKETIVKPDIILQPFGGDLNDLIQVK